LDAIVTVVDAENFVGYEDTSPTAKMQSAYTDLILIVRQLLSCSMLGGLITDIEQVGARLGAGVGHCH
jgi:hypothetical protein